MKNANAVSDSPISPERQAQILARIQSDRQREPQRIEKMRKRQKVGMKIAKQAAEILKTEFNASKVALFGSLLVPENMYERSDIDIAVWGLTKDQAFSAWGVVNSRIDLHGDFPHIDVVPVENAFPHIQRSIKRSHLEL